MFQVELSQSTLSGILDFRFNILRRFPSHASHPRRARMPPIRRQPRPGRGRDHRLGEWTDVDPATAGLPGPSRCVHGPRRVTPSQAPLDYLDAPLRGGGTPGAAAATVASERPFSPRGIAQGVKPEGGGRRRTAPPNSTRSRHPPPFPPNNAVDCDGPRQCGRRDPRDPDGRNAAPS